MILAPPTRRIEHRRSIWQRLGFTSPYKAPQRNAWNVFDLIALREAAQRHKSAGDTSTASKAGSAISREAIFKAGSYVGVFAALITFFFILTAAIDRMGWMIGLALGWPAASIAAVLVLMIAHRVSCIAAGIAAAR